MSPACFVGVVFIFVASLVDNDAGSKVVGFLLIAEGALAIKTPRPRTANSSVRLPSGFAGGVFLETANPEGNLTELFTTGSGISGFKDTEDGSLVGGPGGLGVILETGGTGYDEQQIADGLIGIDGLGIAKDTPVLFARYDSSTAATVDIAILLAFLRDAFGDPDFLPTDLNTGFLRLAADKNVIGSGNFLQNDAYSSLADLGNVNPEFLGGDPMDFRLCDSSADALCQVGQFGTDGFGLDEYDNLKVGFGTTVIPLPAAFPLFGTGLGILGFLGWRRRRKAQAV